MRLTQFFGRTLREAPSGSDTRCLQLASRAGLIRYSSHAMASYLPLGWTALSKIRDMVVRKWIALGAQELSLPPMQAADLLRNSGRYDALRAATCWFRDESNREMGLSRAYEETVLELVRTEVSSHHQLPRFVYQTGWDVGKKPVRHAGLLGMLADHTISGISVHPDRADALSLYDHMMSSTSSVLQASGVPMLVAEAGSTTDEQLRGHCWLFAHDLGRVMFARCGSCEYTAVLSSARMAAPDPIEEAELSLKEVATPNASTIAALAEFLEVPEDRTLKVVFYTVRGRVVCVAIRGDRKVDESKLAAVLQDETFYPSTELELEAVGAVPGYGSPIGLSGVRVIADATVPVSRNLVAGANKAGYHVINVNTPRDFAIDEIADICQVEDGDQCPHCKGFLRVGQAIELAKCMMFGSKLSQALEVNYLALDGKPRAPDLSSYHVSLDAVLAAILESHNDEQGIVWPQTCAPYDTHLVALNLNRPDIAEQAEALYSELLAAGRQVLFDDRDTSAGVKFNDADLIGLPLRITISNRSLMQGGVEVKRRNEESRGIISLSELVTLSD